jgi:asparagine synthase (glutamine-hydrolysing)
MCGIAGFISLSSRENGLELLKSMTDALRHRGPDGEGHWVDESRQVGLGHRRLSIIDLSENASQPMHVNDRYVIIFNGEIYNYLELKELLKTKGYSFRTDSDTEVLVCIYDAFKEKCLQYLDGMFAFVIYDKTEGKVFGARDRFGEKPFFYAFINGCFYFASEIKALWSVGANREADSVFLFNYIGFGYLQDPNDCSKTFYKSIFKLPAAHYFSVETSNLELKIARYWDIEITYQLNEIDETKAVEQFRELFYNSLKRRLRSDVPLGSSLSGGLDSSIIVSALGQIDTENKIRRKTFSASFPGFKKDESQYQKIVIANTSVEPHFVYPDECSFLKNYKEILYHQDEPFGSASINIQYEVFKKAKEESTTVLLDGQGADEILAGYHGYYYAFFDELKRQSRTRYRLEYNKYRQLHHSNSINTLILPPKYGYLKKILPETIKRKLKDSIVKKPLKNLFSSEFYMTHHRLKFTVKEDFRTVNEALHYSIFNFGLEELLRYADRNSMAHSREVRLPFLNHELVAFVFSLPSCFKIRDAWTKWILRKAFENEVDNRIIWRKDKIGYEPPQKDWLSNKGIIEQVHSAADTMVSNGILTQNVVNERTSDDLRWRLLNVSSYL